MIIAPGYVGFESVIFFFVTTFESVIFTRLPLTNRILLSSGNKIFAFNMRWKISLDISIDACDEVFEQQKDACDEVETRE